MADQEFRIDGVIGGDIVAEFASQLGELDPELVSSFEDLFDSGQTEDFYKGLLAGYANSYTLLNNPDGQLAQLGAIVAFVASKIGRDNQLH